jgi:Nif-specific regulatory protein
VIFPEGALSQNRLDAGLMHETLENQTKPHRFRGIVGRSPKLLSVLKKASLIADTKATVLIEGESGTGKELIAHTIHYKSRRAAKLLISLNCGAVPEQLLESEFFGYEKGAFTGAVKSYKGKFEVADGGTIFLDEIDELAPLAQIKLLRVLQRGEFTPLGSHDIRRSDVRIIGATNRDLKELVEKGVFRQDLYYRLNIVKLRLPPLRERREDLPLLIHYFLNTFCADLHKPPLKMHQETTTFLMKYSYLGNIRELENIIHRSVLLCEGNEVVPAHLPIEVRSAGENGPDLAPVTFVQAKQEFERAYLKMVLGESKGVIRKAARRAGLDYKNFYMKLKMYEINPNSYRSPLRD